MLTYQIQKETLQQVDNWATARDLFPTILVDQNGQHVTITTYSVSNYDRGQWGQTQDIEVITNTTGDVMRIIGLVGLRNDRRHTGGQQKFCLFVFRGDSGHFYTHRCTASKGWLTCDPDNFLRRLVKTGIGAVTGVYQQGDFLLRPANRKALQDDEFKHETKGSGHHKFECPVLYAYDGKNRQYWIQEPTILHHTATDGIQHPDITVQPGKYIVGTTNIGLQHSNMRD